MKFPAHKCSLTLTHNDHKDMYETAEQWLAEQILLDGEPFYAWKSEEARARAILTDEVWTLQWYPNTPIGFISIAAPTLDELEAFALQKDAGLMGGGK